MTRRFLPAIAAGVAVVAAALVAAGISTAAPISYPLYAGQTTLVGDVEVSNDATNLYVAIDLDGGWCMTDSKVAVASTLAGIPQTSTGNPKPGQFPYKATHSPCATAYTYTISLTSLGPTPVIAVHLTVWDPASETTIPLVSNTSVTVTSFMGVAQAPAAAAPAYEPVGYPTCGSYVLSPAAGSVWDTQNGGSASNDAGGPFAGATWIWRTSNPEFPNTGEYATFVKGFNLPGPPTTGSILITADNGYQAYLNGAFLGSGQITSPPFPPVLTEAGVSTANWQTPETWSLPLQMGANSLSVIAANEEAYPDVPNIATTGVGGAVRGVCPNPGGLIFKASASYLADDETAWADGGGDFSGANWATYINYSVVYTGDVWMGDNTAGGVPDQHLVFSVSDTPDGGTYSYVNIDATDVSYSGAPSCVDFDPGTPNILRFAYQIPPGEGGLTGLWIVWKITGGGAITAGFSVVANGVAATAACANSAFVPDNPYNVYSGSVNF